MKLHEAHADTASQQPAAVTARKAGETSLPQALIDQSPRMVAQRHVLQALRGDVVQRRETPPPQARIDQSPRMVSQRRVFQALAGVAAQKMANTSNQPRDAGAGASVQRRAAPVVQRYVTFDNAQEQPVVVGHQGAESYDLAKVEPLLTKLFGDKPTDSETFETLGPFLTEAQHICFNSVDSAVEWIRVQRGETEKSKAPKEEKKEEKKTASSEGGGIVWAFRMEGAPKSNKQRSDVAKYVTPQAALDTILSEMGTAVEENEKLITGLREKWSEVALEVAPKKRGELATKLHKQLRSKTLDMKKLLLDVYAKKDLFDEQSATGEIFASRIYLDGTNMIPPDKAKGRVTGLHTWFNFSVGSAEHASYFASTFDKDGSGILIRFALDKGLWRKWKTEQTGPQEHRLGPSSPNTTTTLNDVGQPGVKYEMSSPQTKTFFEEVVVKDIPAQVTPLAPVSSAWKPSGEDVQRTVQRLAKAQRKLQEELEGLESSTSKFEPERAQNATAKEQLQQEWLPAPIDQMKALYTAMNLTKNALHSVRRKKGPQTL